MSYCELILCAELFLYRVALKCLGIHFCMAGCPNALASSAAIREPHENVAATHDAGIYTYLPYSRRHRREVAPARRMWYYRHLDGEENNGEPYRRLINCRLIFHIIRG